MPDTTLPGEFSLETRTTAFRLANDIGDLIYAAGIDPVAASLALASAIQSIADDLDADPSELLDESMEALACGAACVSLDEVTTTGAPGIVSIMMIH